MSDDRTVSDYEHQKHILDLAILRNRARVSLDIAYDTFEQARETVEERQEAYAERQEAHTGACAAYVRELVGTPVELVAASVNSSLGDRTVAPRPVTGDKEGRGVLDRIVALERVNKELLEYFSNHSGSFIPSLIDALLAVRDGPHKTLSPDMRPPNDK